MVEPLKIWKWNFFSLRKIQLQQNLNGLEEYIYFDEIIAGNT